MRRFAFAVIAALALLVFAGPLMRGQVFDFRDHGDYFQPLRYFTAFELRHGHLPLWNAYNASGEPWLANPQTAVFYPPAWLFVVLPFVAAYMLYLLLHLALLGWGAYLLFARAAPPGAALAGAIALMFCGPVMSLLDISNNLTTFAWIPLVLWCAAANVSPQWSAVAIAMSFLAGEPFFAAAAALLFVIIRRRDVVEVALTSFGLAAIQLLPFLAMVGDSDRAGGGVPREQMLRDSMPLRDWLRIAIPPNTGGGAYDLHLTQHFIPIVYVGGLTLLFAVMAVVAALAGAQSAERDGAARKPSQLRAHVGAALLLIAVCVVVAGGNYIPPIAEILARLPLTLFRYPARLVPLAALAICGLAAIGCGHAVKAQRWQLVIALLMFADVIVQVRPLLRTAPFNPQPVPYDRTVGRDAKIVRIGIERTRAVNRTAWIAGYLNLFGRRFDAWTAAPLTSERYTELYENMIVAARSDRLSSTSIGYVLASGILPRFEPIAAVGGVVVHRNPAAFPMAYFLDDATQRIAHTMSLAFTTNSAQIVLDAPSDGVVILTQQMASGWRVDVDGKRENPQKMAVFRAVHVTRGHHQIIWRYRPLSLFIGAILTLMAVARMIFFAVIVKRRAQEKFFAAP